MLADDPQNAALSLLRLVSRALVQEPQMWQFILDRADNQAKKLGAPIAVEAIHALRSAFSTEAPTNRAQLHQLAERFLVDDPVRRSMRTSFRALAGQTLLTALRESPARAVAQ